MMQRAEQNQLWPLARQIKDHWSKASPTWRWFTWEGLPDFSWGLVSVGLKSRGLFLTTEAKFGRFFLLLLQPFWQPDQWNDVERRRDWRRTLPGLTKLEPHVQSLALVLKPWPSSSARRKITSRSPKGGRSGGPGFDSRRNSFSQKFVRKYLFAFPFHLSLFCCAVFFDQCGELFWFTGN